MNHVAEDNLELLVLCLFYQVLGLQVHTTTLGALIICLDKGPSLHESLSGLEMQLSGRAFALSAQGLGSHSQYQKEKNKDIMAHTLNSSSQEPKARRLP